MVTEYCSDGDLESLIRSKQRIKESDAFEYLAQIISAVHYLHSKNIVHRDIKPENILFSGKTLKLIDFGLSNTYSPRGRLKTPCGSPCFAPPEMVCGLEYDPIKSDIWSIGITLYYMVTGSLPFMEKELKSLYQKIVACEINYPDYLSENMKNLLGIMLCSNPKTRMSIQSLVEMPLLHSLSSPINPQKGINEDILKSAVKSCKIPEALLREFIKNQNKNGFTAHYYLELHSHAKSSQIYQEVTPSKHHHKQAAIVDPQFKTPQVSAKKERLSEKLEHLDDKESSTRQEKKTFKLVVDTEFDGTMFYSKNTDRSMHSNQGTEPKKGSQEKRSPRLAERYRSNGQDKSVLDSAIKMIKDSVSDKGSLDVKKKNKHKLKDGLLDVVLGRKTAMVGRGSTNKIKKSSPGTSLTNRHPGITSIPAEGLKIKSRSPSQRKNSKESKPKHKKRITGEIKSTLRGILGAKLKSREKVQGTSKTFRPRDGVFALPKEYFTSNQAHTSRSPNTSRPRKTDKEPKTLDRIQNIFIKNSTLVNHMVSPRPNQALPFTNQPPSGIASAKTKTSSGAHKSTSQRSQQYPKTSLFTLMHNDKSNLEYGSPRGRGSSKSHRLQYHGKKMPTSPGTSYTDKSTKQASRSSKLERSGMRLATLNNDSEYLMTANDKRSSRGQKFKLQSKVYDILKNIVKD